MSKRPPSDENGNELPPIDPTTDVGMLVQLLEWGRRRGFKIGPTIQVGTVTVQVEDIRLRENARAGEKKPDEGDIYVNAGYDPDATE